MLNVAIQLVAAIHSKNDGPQPEGGDGRVRIISPSSAFRFCSVFLSSASFIAVDTEGGGPVRLLLRWARLVPTGVEGPRRCDGLRSALRESWDCLRSTLFPRLPRTREREPCSPTRCDFASPSATTRQRCNGCRLVKCSSTSPTDHGLRWRMVDKADPKADHFDFLAPSDGEYWFAVRTLDAFSRLHPAGNNIEPALKVLVDATPPVLELLLTELESGKIELRWTAADDHLDVSKLRIEYRQPDSPDWQPAAVVPQPSGQTTWEVKGGGVVAVRGSISDLAGNTVNAERELNVHPSPHGQKKGSETEYHAPVAKAADSPGADLPVREAAALNSSDKSPTDNSHSSPPEREADGFLVDARHAWRSRAGRQGTLVRPRFLRGR